MRDVDVVLDTVGGDTMSRSWRVLRPGGVLVGIASAPSDSEARRHHARGVYFIVEPSRAGLERLAALAGAGRLRTAPGRVFPMRNAAAAFEALGHQHVRGKVVLAVRPGPGWAGAR